MASASDFEAGGDHEAHIGSLLPSANAGDGMTLFQRMNQHEVEKGSVEIPDDLNVPSGSFSWKKLWAFSGPGILMRCARAY